jgi:SAM-dependent methyltransferase
MEFRNPGAVIEETIRVRKLKSFFSQLTPKTLLIDLACGSRPYALLYRHKFERTIGIEHPDSPFPKNDVDIYCLADSIPLESNTADVILATEMLHDIAEPTSVLDETFRLLKPGGYLLLTTPFLVPIVDGRFDHYRYTRYGLTYLLDKSGYEIVTTEQVGDIISSGITLFTKPWLRFWNMLSKRLHLSLIYSYWNPLFLLTVVLPQVIFLLVENVPPFSLLFKRFNYGCIGYYTVARKPGGKS